MLVEYAIGMQLLDPMARHSTDRNLNGKRKGGMESRGM